MKDTLNKLSPRRDKKIYNEEIIYWSSTSTEYLDFSTKKKIADGLHKKISESLNSYDSSIELHVYFHQKLLKKNPFFKLEDLTPSLKLVSLIYDGMEDDIVGLNCFLEQTALRVEIAFNEYQDPINLRDRVQVAMKKNVTEKNNQFKSLECYISGEKDGNTLNLKFSTEGLEETEGQKVNTAEFKNSQLMEV